MDEPARPLIEALIGEVHRLLHKLRRAARHNHELLARTVELHQETLQQLRPESFSKTYSPGGRMTATLQPASSLRATG
jgi:flagellar biosynthesis/type III secretory pathway chaperone